MRIIVLPRAGADIDRHYEYLFEQSPSAAERFIDAVAETFGRLSASPRLGRPRPMRRRSLANLRSVQVAGFRSYLVFYRVGRDRVTIVRLLHGAMDLPVALADL